MRKPRFQDKDGLWWTVTNGADDFPYYVKPSQNTTLTFVSYNGDVYNLDVPYTYKLKYIRKDKKLLKELLESAKKNHNNQSPEQKPKIERR